MSIEETGPADGRGAWRHAPCAPGGGPCRLRGLLPCSGMARVRFKLEKRARTEPADALCDAGRRGDRYHDRGRHHLHADRLQRARRRQRSVPAAGAATDPLAGCGDQGLAADPHRRRAGGWQPRRHLEYRRRGTIHRRRAGRHRHRLADPERRGSWILPSMLVAGLDRRSGVGRHPGAAQDPFQRQRDAVEPDADLCGDPSDELSGHRAVEGPAGLQFPADGAAHLRPDHADADPGHGGASTGCFSALIIALIMWVVMSRSVFGFQVRVVGSAPNAARHGGFSEKATVWLVFLLSGGLAGLAGIFEVTGPFAADVDSAFRPNYGFTAIIVAFLGRLTRSA